MELPVIRMDVVFLASILAAALLVGLIVGWLWTRRRRRVAGLAPLLSGTRSGAIPSTDRLFLRLLSRYDHSLGNYVSSIIGNLNNLTREGDELPTDVERWRVSRQAIAESANDMRRQIERLRLVRLGLDPSSRRLEPVDLRQMIEGILIELNDPAEKRGVKLRMEVGRLTQPVLGDSQMFAEIFTTLLDNAIKHSGGTEVVAEVTGQEETALVRISDNGKGMGSDLVDRIFEEGARDRGAGSSSGSGMGLYIARVLTELHGGTISVESNPDKGSTFAVALPLSKSSPS